MDNTPPRTHPYSTIMDDRFNAWYAEMEKRQEEYEQRMQSLLQHAEQLK